MRRARVGPHCRFCNAPAPLLLGRVDFFLFRPPLSENPGDASHQEQILSSPNSQHPGSHVVLVVDDDPDILEALSEILEAEGFEIRRARNGKEALERLDSPRPQLILLDLMMPVMDGWEFAQQMRQRPDVAPASPSSSSARTATWAARRRTSAPRGTWPSPSSSTICCDLVRSSLQPPPRLSVRGLRRLRLDLPGRPPLRSAPPLIHQSIHR